MGVVRMRMVGVGIVRSEDGEEGVVRSGGGKGIWSECGEDEERQRGRSLGCGSFVALQLYCNLPYYTHTHTNRNSSPWSV